MSLPRQWAAPLRRMWGHPLLWQLLLVLAMGLILLLSLVPPGPELPTTGWDKSNHILGFAVLAFLGLKAWPRRTLQVLALLLAYGGLIELLQSLTPQRSAEWADLWADALGLLLGGAAHWLLTHKLGREN